MVVMAVMMSFGVEAVAEAAAELSTALTTLLAGESLTAIDGALLADAARTQARTRSELRRGASRGVGVVIDAACALRT